MYARLASIRLPFFAIIHHLGWSVLISPEKYQMCSPKNHFEIRAMSQTRINKINSIKSRDGYEAWQLIERAEQKYTKYTHKNKTLGRTTALVWIRFLLILFAKTFEERGNCVHCQRYGQSDFWPDYLVESRAAALCSGFRSLARSSENNFAE